MKPVLTKLMPIYRVREQAARRRMQEAKAAASKAHDDARRANSEVDARRTALESQRAAVLGDRQLDTTMLRHRLDFARSVQKRLETAMEVRSRKAEALKEALARGNEAQGIYARQHRKAHVLDEASRDELRHHRRQSDRRIESDQDEQYLCAWAFRASESTGGRER